MTVMSVRTAAILSLGVALALPLAGAQGGRQGGPGSRNVGVPEPNRGGTIDASAQDPAVALARLHPAEGYEVQLFASEREFPDLANPMAMTFDSRGRLWVLTSPTYPHALPGVVPDDKLIILEDTNGDGRADRSKVFADRLYQPMGFELGDGGAYVSQQPNLVFLRDTNGDDRADERTIVLHGFGTEDSHHAIHAFQWGPGGDLYFQEGTFFHTQVETPYGPVRTDYGAVYRYEPRKAKLGVFVTYRFDNPWGHVVDRWGQNFISDASNGNNYWGTPFSGHMAYPAKQDPMKVWTLTQVRPTGGNEIVSSRHFPESAQGNFLIANTIGFHGIKQYKVLDEGAGFVGVETDPLVYSTDQNFRPVALQFGPEGALYVVDWFNPLVGHMQYSLRDPRRDKSRGRIWRVVATGRPFVTRPAIDRQPIAAQLELLKAYEDRTRYRARRALRDQPAGGVIAALKTWTAALDPQDPEYEHHLLEALWVSESHDVVDVALLDRLLAATQMQARAAAVRVLQHWYDRVPDATGRLRRAAADPEPRVRLEAVRALSFVPTIEAVNVALSVLAQPTDYYLDYTLRSTTRALKPVWRPALANAAQVASGQPAGLAYLLDSLEPAELATLPGSLPVYEAILRRPGVEPRARSIALDRLAAANGRSTVQELVAAIDRLDGEPGRMPVVRDLSALFATASAAALTTVRGDLDRLARSGQFSETREAAFRAVIRADGQLDAAWRAAATPHHRIDFLRSLTALDDRSMWPAAFEQIRSVLDAPPTSAAPVLGRYVRIALPGPGRKLSLAEVEVISGGANVARSGRATQSSVVASGSAGGHAAAAVDGDTAGTVAFASFTDDQSDPWWEVDLGTAQPIDRIVVWNRTDAAARLLEGFHLRVLDGRREPVAVFDSMPAPGPSVSVDVGGNVSARLVDAAIAALVHVPDRDADVFGLLMRQFDRGTNQRAVIDAVRQIPRARWPNEALGRLAQGVVAYVRSIPNNDRSSAHFTEVVAFGRELAGGLPGAERGAIETALDDATVRVIQLTALVGTLKWDVEQFSVQPNELVEIVIANPDVMPHNLLITAPGRLEEVGRAAEAMASQPDAFQRQFVPDTPDVLFKTALIASKDSARLRFRAPAVAGDYPYLCSFPGHWMTMKGVMQVAAPGGRGGGRRGGRPGGPPPGAPARGSAPAGAAPPAPR
jgi:glucose/arabinose dehydrogenase